MRTKLTTIAALAILSACASTEPQYQTASQSVPLARSAAEAAHARGNHHVPSSLKLDAPPRVLSSPFPNYPESFRAAGIAGKVSVQFYIEPDGTVSNPTVIGSPPHALAAIVLNAIMQWKFSPAMRAGAAVRVPATQEFTFKLEERPHGK